MNARTRSTLSLERLGRRALRLPTGLYRIGAGRLLGRRVAPRPRKLEVGEAAATLAGYERRNRLLAPVVRGVLSRLAGFRYDGSEEGRRPLFTALPLLGLGPARPSER